MTFRALAHSAEKLRAALHSAIGKHLIEDVSLSEPGEERGEAAFIKSVLWGYVLWFEACQPAGQYLMNIVRNSSAEDHKVAARAFQDLQNLRTFHAHNLVASSKSDQYKLSQARAWLVQNGGAEGDWDRCTDSLCSGLATSLDILYQHWSRVTASSEDAVHAIQGMKDALEREWEPHIFDRIIEEVTILLGLPDFDPVKYRKDRLQDWRRLTEFFLDRGSAEAAVRRAIHQELALKFGTGPA